LGGLRRLWRLWHPGTNGAKGGRYEPVPKLLERGTRPGESENAKKKKKGQRREIFKFGFAGGGSITVLKKKSPTWKRGDGIRTDNHNPSPTQSLGKEWKQRGKA